jgi:hypothetical protein
LRRALAPSLCELILSSLPNARCTAFPPLLRAIGVNLIVAVFHTGNGRCARHIQKMEKFIALTVVIAIVVFAATYALSAWSEHR